MCLSRRSWRALSFTEIAGQSSGVPSLPIGMWTSESTCEVVVFPPQRGLLLGLAQEEFQVVAEISGRFLSGLCAHNIPSPYDRITCFCLSSE